MCLGQGWGRPQFLRHKIDELSDDDFDDDGDFFSDDSDCGFGMDDSLNDEMQDDSEQEDDAIEIGREEIAIIGGMVEEFAEEDKGRRKLEKKIEADRNNRDREDDI